MKLVFCEARFICFALLMSAPASEAFSQVWEAKHINDCEQIISSSQFYQGRGPWIVVAGGSSPTDENYHKAQNISLSLAKNGYSVVTGSGLGIMKAANEIIVRSPIFPIAYKG